MKPIYFPFTYVPQGVTRALAACFRGFIVYQPSGKKLPDQMQPWVETNVMEVRVPDQTDDQAIEKVVEAFRSFAGLHYDSKNLKTAVLSGQLGAIPFFSETSTSRIVSDLKKGGSSESAGTETDPLFCARVFLGFAQDFDRQRDELNQGIGVHEQQSFDLLKRLKGEMEIDSAAIAFAPKSKIDDPGGFMAMTRLQAWTLLFREDPVGSGLFITSSKSVFNELMAKMPPDENMLQSVELPVNEIKNQALDSWRDSFLMQLNRLAETPWSASRHISRDLPLYSGGGTDVTLTICLIPGQIPSDYFARYFDSRQPPLKQPLQKSRFKNTLVGLVECPP